MFLKPSSPQGKSHQHPSPAFARSSSASQHFYGEPHSLFFLIETRNAEPTRYLLPPTIHDMIDSRPEPLSQPDVLRVVLNAETAMYATIMRGCKRQLDGLSASLSRKDPAIRSQRHALSHALLEATLSNTRQATLCIELCIASDHRRRSEGNSSGLEPAIDHFLDTHFKLLWMRFPTLARMFDSVVYVTHVVVRHTASLCKETIGQGVRIQRARLTCGRGCVHTRWRERRRATKSQNKGQREMNA